MEAEHYKFGSLSNMLPDREKETIIKLLKINNIKIVPGSNAEKMIKQYDEMKQHESLTDIDDETF